MSMETLKLEKGLCRCCHNEGVHKNLADPCLNAGEVEIYVDMLQSCLDINLTPLPGPHCAVTYTICENCIERLRDACSFKKQVNECEQRFREYFTKNDIKLATCADIEVKRENTDDEDVEVKVNLSPIHNDDDFRDDFGNDDDTKVEIDIDIKSGPRKLRPKKTKAPEKTKAKSKPARKPKDETAKNTESRKKVLVYLTTEDLVDFTGVGEKKYRCNKCDAILGSCDSMRQHILAYHNHKYYQCPKCTKKFKQKALKTAHLAKHHDLEEVIVNRKRVLQKRKRYTCDECQKELLSRSNLVRHIRLHRMAVCPECSVSFKSSQLPRHRSDEHGVPISTCGVCGYKNSSRSRVATHQQRVHLREKHISCSQCDDMFFDMRGLRNHLVKHNPEKIFACSFCKKKFPRMSALRAHEKIHTGEKNKVCPVCDERFVQKASLNYHMTRHHPSFH